MENSNLLQGLIDLFVELKMKDEKIKAYAAEEYHKNMASFMQTSLAPNQEYLHKEDVKPKVLIDIYYLVDYILNLKENHPNFTRKEICKFIINGNPVIIGKTIVEET